MSSTSVYKNTQGIDEGFGLMLVYCDKCTWREPVDDLAQAYYRRGDHAVSVHGESSSSAFRAYFRTQARESAYLIK
jgi:hypothetical protein